MPRTCMFGNLPGVGAGVYGCGMDTREAGQRWADVWERGWREHDAAAADSSDVGHAEVGDRDGHPVLHLHGTPGSRLEVCIPAARRAAEELGVRLIGLGRPGMGLSTFRRGSGL